MDGPSEAGALETITPVSDVAVSGAARPHKIDSVWDVAPDASASTCVSGSEGSVPQSTLDQSQKALQQQHSPKKQHPQQQRMEHSQPEGEKISESVESFCSATSPVHQPKQRTQQYAENQHQRVLRLHAVALSCPRLEHTSSGSDGSECEVHSVPPVTEVATLVAAPHIQRSSSNSSSCSSSSIGGELKGLISALAAADTAGSNELQQLLQQLLAERDLYKAAFGAAKEELKDLESRQQHLTKALHTAEQERMQQQLQQLEVADKATRHPQDCAVQLNSSSVQQQVIDSSRVPTSNSAEGPFVWLQQLHACVASGTYPRPDLLQKSVEQQQQLIRLAEVLQQERESYVEAVACLHSQLREAREDVSLYMSAHATHAADLTAESDEALRAADLWLQYSLRSGTKCKLWGLGSVIHSQEAAAASSARKCSTPVVRACSSSAQSEACAAAAAAALLAAEEPPPGVSVAFAAAAAVFGVQDDSVGDEVCSPGTATAGGSGPAAPTELERLWWGRSSDVFMEKQQLRMQHRQRERNNRLLWFLE